MSMNKAELELIQSILIRSAWEHEACERFCNAVDQDAPLEERGDLLDRWQWTRHHLDKALVELTGKTKAEIRELLRD